MPNPVIDGPAPDLAGFREVYPAQRTFWAPAHPSNYRSPRRNPHPWVGIVWHTPEEEAGDDIFVAPWWFQQEHPGREGSTYLAIEGDGDLFQCVRFADYAFAQGAALNAVYRLLPDCLLGLPSFNNGLMSIEVEGRALTINETFQRGTPQWTTAIRVAAWFCLEQPNPIPIDRDHMIGHDQIPNQSHWDPNFTSETWRWLLEDITLETEKLQSAAPTVPLHHHILERAPVFRTGPPLTDE